MRIAWFAGLMAMALGCTISVTRHVAATSWTALCFYDSGDVYPTARCRQLVAAMVDHWRASGGRATCAGRTAVSPVPDGPASRIEVQGHGDGAEQATGTVDRLARERADAVVDLLLASCVPAEAIVSRSFGATRPHVPAPPGADEPENRRVEIIPR